MFVIILILAVIIYLLLRPKPAEPEPDRVITRQNADIIEQDITKKVEKGYFQTHMNTTWVFNDGKSHSANAVVGNAEANNYPFYFEVMLSDTKEVIYKSPVLGIGDILEKFKLDKELTPGDYNAVCKYHLIDEEGEEVESNVGFNISIQVDN